MSTDWYGPGGGPDRATGGYDRDADYGQDEGGYYNGRSAGNGSADWARQSRASHRAPDPYDPHGSGRGQDPYPPEDPYGAPDPYANTDPYRGRDSYQGRDPYADPYQEPPYQGRDDYPGQERYSPYGDDGGADQWQRRQDGYPGDDHGDSGPYRWQPPAQQQDPYAEDYADHRYQEDPYGADDHYQGGGQYRADPYPEQRAYHDDQYDSGPYADHRDDYQAGGDVRGGRQAGRYAAQDEPDEWDERQQRSRGFFTGFGEEAHPPARPRKRKRSKAPFIILPILLIILGALGGGGYYVWHKYEAKYADYTGSGYGMVTVTVPAGGSADSLAPLLVKDGVIAGTRQFVTVAAASGKASSLQPGVYKLHKHMSAAAAWALLLNPKARVNADVTIPEGLRATKIIALLAAKTGKPISEFDAALRDTPALGLPSYAHGNPEGYLFPDTYDFSPGASALSMLQTMVKEFKTQASNIHLVAAARAAKLTPAQIITEASLVEAEVNQTQYYPKVARVIDNKLNDLIPLELDSTIAYITNDYSYNYTYAQLHTPSPYNTFLHLGLPPGPIDSPGTATIAAVLHPSPSTDTWTYFVTVNKAGLTKFTSSETQFEIWSNEAKRNGV